MKQKQLLGQLLIDNNLITQQQLEEALIKQKEIGKLIGEVLLELGFIRDEQTLLPYVARQYNVNFQRLKSIDIPPQVVGLVPQKMAKRYTVIPISLENEVLHVAMNHPHNFLLRDELSMATGKEIKPVLASREDILFAISKFYSVGAETIQAIVRQKKPVEMFREEVPDLMKTNSDATISNFLNQIFLEAYHKRATDIHIEPFDEEVVVRYRIDGVLCEVSVPEDVRFFKDSINSRIKILSNLDITEKRLPQDGRFCLRVGEVDLDLRVSFLPSRHGESVVIRILNPSQFFCFEDLDLTVDETKILKELITKPNGIIFITGPTGSGKTTTLYTCLSNINTADKKIITIEDPVEYQLRGIIQIQINPAIHLSFARGLRSVLRHDPNVIMVGEVRDVEAAEIAIQAALTGHLIFTTIHTNDAASGVTRLLNMGVEPYLITSTVECFLAQRLVRVICPHCKEPKKLKPEMIKQLKVKIESKNDINVFEGKGCEYCHYTGYYGRIGIFEFLVLNEEINQLILQRAGSNEIKNKAVEMGMRPLRQSGWEKVRAGITTAQEVIRVTQGRSRRK